MLSDLIMWLYDATNKHEYLDIHPWTKEWLYVVVRDRRIGKYPEDALVGFTVNLPMDLMMWCSSKDQPHGNSHGGNCFLRSERWYKLLKQKFPQAIRDRDFHDYRKSRRPR